MDQLMTNRNFLQPSHTFEKEVQMYSLVFIDMARYLYYIFFSINLNFLV